MSDSTPRPSIEVNNLTYTFPDSSMGVSNISLSLPPRSRTLLIGANGAGKTTLLRVLAGKHMVDPSAVRVLGTSAFHDPSLSSKLELLGGRFPFEVDLRVAEILERQRDVDPARRAQLIELLGVDLEWHMHAVSDGQRRRVQLLLGLLRPRDVLLLDEISTDLDLIARQDLLRFLREESEGRGTTILYATHIFDTLDRWATDMLYIVAGRILVHAPLSAIPELAAPSAEPLVAVVERWLRRDMRKP